MAFEKHLAVCSVHATNSSVRFYLLNPGCPSELWLGRAPCQGPLAPLPVVFEPLGSKSKVNVDTRLRCLIRLTLVSLAEKKRNIPTF